MTLDVSEIRAIAEEVADVLAERGLVAGEHVAGLLSAEPLADALGTERSWIHRNADRLRALRIGPGPKSRMRFDLETARRALAAPAPVSMLPRGLGTRGARGSWVHHR